MSTPKVSIIMPTYNNGKYIGEAIESVLEQTYPNWELIVIDDGSTDDTAEIVTGFAEPRIRYIRQANRGVCVARNVGVEAAKGDYIAFLDADDRYRPDKLSAQVAHLDTHPEIGLTYGSRIEIDEHGQLVNLARLPGEATLETVVLSFPFAPTDIIVRRHWIDICGGFRQGFVVNEDRDLYIRLVLAGCRCVGLPEFLAYRRLNTQKTFRDLPARLDDMLRALDTAFGDVRCSQEIKALYRPAHRNVYLSWAYQAAIQGESSLAEEYWDAVLHYDPDSMADDGKKLSQSLVRMSTRDGGDHETRLRRVFAQLPASMTVLASKDAWSVARGYLVQGVENTILGRTARGQKHLAHALALGAQVDEPFLRTVVEQLLNHEAAFGAKATQPVLHELVRSLGQVGTPADIRWLQGCYAVNRAFTAYRHRCYTGVIKNAFQAIIHDPAYLMNRGVIALSIRSIIGAWRQPFNYVSRAEPHLPR